MVLFWSDMNGSWKCDKREPVSELLWIPGWSRWSNRRLSFVFEILSPLLSQKRTSLLVFVLNRTLVLGIWECLVQSCLAQRRALFWDFTRSRSKVRNRWKRSRKLQRYRFGKKKKRTKKKKDSVSDLVSYSEWIRIEFKFRFVSLVLLLTRRYHH